MKTFAVIVLLAASAWAIDPPKSATVEFTPELQNKLLKVMTQELQIERNLNQLNEDYRRVYQQLQDQMKKAQAQEQALQEQTLKQLLLDPKTHTITLDANGDLKVNAMTPAPSPAPAMEKK